MIICKNCREENSGESNFCIKCGLSLQEKNTIKCPNGHLYDGTLSRCPYCPSQDLQSAMGFGKTVNIEPSNIFKMDNQNLEKTNLIEHNVNQNFSNDISAKKTVIVSNENPIKKSGRKLVGWLVTFTWDKNGKDFKIYEGRNIISGKSDTDIFIDDPAVSSPHCLILYRNEEFKIKDELSTNGTLLNGEMIELASLKDGDVLTLGTTELKFRVL
jgi:hypothetical protein